MLKYVETRTKPNLLLLDSLIFLAMANMKKININGLVRHNEQIGGG